MVVLHLRLRIAPERRHELLTFLANAVAFYQAPGGIRVGLLERRGRPEELIEVIEYDSIERYRADQDRVEHDPHMRELLERWRGLLLEPPVVETYDDLTSAMLPPR